MYDQWILNTGISPTFSEEDQSRYVVIYWDDGLTPTIDTVSELKHYDWGLEERDDRRNIYAYMIIGDHNGV